MRKLSRVKARVRDDNPARAINRAVRTRAKRRERNIL